MTETSSFYQDRREISAKMTELDELLQYFADKHGAVPIIANVKDTDETIQPETIITGFTCDY